MPKKCGFLALDADSLTRVGMSRNAKKLIYRGFSRNENGVFREEHAVLLKNAGFT